MKTQISITTLSFDFALKILKAYSILVSQKEFVLSKQLLRSGTSIGANIAEATAGQTKRDFIAKMSIASKEARETRYWLQLLQRGKIVDTDFSPYLKDIEDIIKILTKIVKTAQQNLKSDTHT